jgi:xanthine dehydrogenase YagS FAD-binding subunit
MKAFGYERAESPTQAVKAVSAESNAMYLGGGTNLVDLMRLGVYRPDRVVDVSALPLKSIERLPDGRVLIGAAVTNSDLGSDPVLRSQYPVLSQALLAGASGQIRNIATIAGNLLQRTRCTYFQDISKPCNKRLPGSGCPARHGVNRDLAVIGHAESCIATHPSDMAVALSALDARIHVLGVDDTRVLALDDFYRLPAADPTRDTALRHGDLVTGVELPAPSGLSARSAYRKVRDRASFAFAVGAVAVAIAIDEGVIGDIRLSFGAVAPRPWRARLAERELRGKPISAAAFKAALDLEFGDAEPFPQNTFKIPLARRIAVATLLELAGGPQ